MKRIPFQPHPYDRLVPKLQEYFPEMVYEKACQQLLAADDVLFERIIYDSDGLNVTGALAIPRNIDKPLPMLLFNRGGSRDYGMLSAPVLMRIFYRFAKRGYIVIGSNYRGNDGSDGEELFGGDDVRDVLNLAAYSSHAGQWDGRNLFMLGWSRGGMMSYLALKHGINVNAAASIAGISDITSLDVIDDDFIQRIAPSIAAMDAAARQQAFDARSAIGWAHAINAPLLLLHGDADTIVPASQSIALAEQLAAHHIPHELILYENGDHTLKRHKEETDEAVDAWFKRHMS